MVEPLPSSRLGQAQFLQPADHCFARDPKKIREQNDMSSGQLRSAGGDLLKLRHHGTSGGQEATPESVGVALLPARLRRAGMERIGCASGRNEMPEFVPTGLRTPITRMRSVEQYTGPGDVIERVETGNFGIEAANIHTGAELKFKKADDVPDWCESQPQPLPKLPGILLRLQSDIALEEGALGRIESRARDAKQVLELNLRLDEIVEKHDRGFDLFVLLPDLPKARTQIDLRRVLPKQFVERSPVQRSPLLKLIDACAPLALLYGHQSCASDAECERGGGLRDLRVLACLPQQIANCL